MPPLRFMEMSLVATAEEEVKQSFHLAQEALGGPHKDRWPEAMNIEMESISENELVDKLVGKKNQT